MDSPALPGPDYMIFKRAFIYGEYRLTVVDQRVQFVLYDNSNSASQFVYASAGGGDVPLGEWNHIVITYDGRGGTGAAANTANLGMSIYINGSDHTGARSYTLGYKGMMPNWGTVAYPAAELVIRNYAPAAAGLFEGEIAEIALWNRELPEEDILTIYNATRNGTYELFTGYLNNPVRTVIRSRDNASCVYAS